jgi:GxxExxY protein
MAGNDELERLARTAIDCAYHVHLELGPGLLESVYEIILMDSLRQRGLCVKRQVWIPIHYNGRQFDEGFRADLLVEDQLLLELRAGCG